MPWVHLFIAGLLEVAWAVTLKWSEGFTNFAPTAATTAFTLISFYFLSQAMKAIPIGTTYAVLAGIGRLERSSLASCFSLRLHILCADDQRFINHESVSANILSTPRQDVAARDIFPGEELVCDYNCYDDTYFNRAGMPQLSNFALSAH